MSADRRWFLVALLVLVSICGCRATARSSGAQRAPRPPLQIRDAPDLLDTERLAALAEAPPAGLRLRAWVVGRFGLGWRVEARGDGRLLGRRYDGLRWAEEYEERLPQATLQRLLRHLVQERVFSLQPQREVGVPDEARPTIALLVPAGDGTWLRRRISVWENELDQEPVFRSAWVQFEALARSLGAIERARPW